MSKKLSNTPELSACVQTQAQTQGVFMHWAFLQINPLMNP